MTDSFHNLLSPKLAQGHQALEPISRAGQAIRSLNALAVGTLAAFSLEKTLVIFGVVAAGTLPMGTALVAMIFCGLAITAITYSMYHQDSWRIMLSYFVKMRDGLREKWKSFWQNPQSEKIQQMQPRQSGFLAIDVYGHLGGAIKFFMAFAGLWLLAYGSVAFLPLIALMVIIGVAQYFTEASVLIPHSQELFTAKPHERASPMHTVGNASFTGFKWLMVVAHALGQGLGFFACMALFGTLPVPLMLAIGVMAMLIIGPSTGRFYGERFFRWGTTISLNPKSEGEHLGKYAMMDMEKALTDKHVSPILIQRDAYKALRIYNPKWEKVRQKDCQNGSQQEPSNDFLDKSDAEKMLRYFGYYLSEPNKLQWKSMTIFQKIIYSFGGMVGCFGAAFKGALAFAGAVGLLLLVTVGALAITGTPPIWIIGVAGFIGVATWVVQCSRACPNTASGFVTWTMKKQQLNLESSYESKKPLEMEPISATDFEHWAPVSGQQPVNDASSKGIETGRHGEDGNNTCPIVERITFLNI